MSKQKQDGRGRPRKELVFPRGKFTVNSLIPLNPEIKCRLTLYTRCEELVKQRVLRLTGKTIAGKVGKPLNEFQTVASYRAAKTLKRANKARKLAAVTVDLTPAPTPATPVVA